MTLGTGTAVPTGPITVGEDLFVVGGPRFFFQPYTDCPEANEPDSDNFYWGLSGTPACPIYEMGCYEDISLIDEVTRNPVSCDSLGTVDEVQRRESMELQATVKAIFPLTQFALFMRGGTVTVNAAEESEKFGIGRSPTSSTTSFSAASMTPSRATTLASPDTAPASLRRRRWRCTGTTSGTSP